MNMDLKKFKLEILFPYIEYDRYDYGWEYAFEFKSFIEDIDCSKEKQEIIIDIISEAFSRNGVKLTCFDNCEIPYTAKEKEEIVHELKKTLDNEYIINRILLIPAGCYHELKEALVDILIRLIDKNIYYQKDNVKQQLLDKKTNKITYEIKDVIALLTKGNERKLRMMDVVATNYLTDIMNRVAGHHLGDDTIIKLNNSNKYHLQVSFTEDGCVKIKREWSDKVIEGIFERDSITDIKQNTDKYVDFLYDVMFFLLRETIMDLIEEF